ncbi:hypothetical protein D3C75_1260360 [compost metagenome]
MPSGTPTSTHRPVLTSTRARVCSNLSQSPSIPIKASSATSTALRSRLRLACQASRPTSNNNSHQGKRRNRFSRPTSSCSNWSDKLRRWSP